MFADHPIGLIRTDPGRRCAKGLQSAVEVFPNAKYMIAVGVCYGFPQKTKFGDVIISQFITDLGNVKVADEIIARGNKTEMDVEIRAIFCDSPNVPKEFIVSKQKRSARHFVGNIMSTTQLIADGSFRDKIYAIAQEKTYGGEMEGGELLLFQSEQKEKGKNISVIVIKAVADFGDFNKEKSWQFISAKAAFHYVHCKLENR